MNRTSYIVIGGGLSGLTSACLLSKLRPNSIINIIESNSKCGGWLKSIKSSSKSGAVFDLGPHSARNESPTSLFLINYAQFLGLDKSINWMYKKGVAGRRYIFAKDKLIPVSLLSPNKFEVFTRSPLHLAVKKVFDQHYDTLDEESSDMSIDDFLRTRLDDEFADYYGSAMVRGIFSGDSRDLSVKACMPSLLNFDRRGSNFVIGAAKSIMFPDATLLKPTPPIIQELFDLSGRTSKPTSKAFAWTLSGGMETLIRAIINELKQSPNVKFRLNSEVENIHAIPNATTSDNFTVSVINKKEDQKSTIMAKSIFATIPVANLMDMLKEDVDLTSNKLSEMPWANVAVCAMELGGGKITLKHPGFGHLVPICEDRMILGVIYDSEAFPELDGYDSSGEKTTRFTVMIKPPDNWSYPDGKCNSYMISEAACQAVKNHLDVDVYSKHKPIAIHCDIMKNCIPQYMVGHKNYVEQFKNSLTDYCNLTSSGHIYPIGTSYSGVSVSDAAYSAMDAVAQELNL